MDRMPHDEPQDLPRLPAQLDRLLDEVFAAKRELARQQRIHVLLQGLSPEVAHGVGRSLLDQMLAAEGDQAAEEARREFPEYVQEVTRRLRRGEQR